MYKQLRPVTGWLLRWSVSVLLSLEISGPAKVLDLFSGSGSFGLGIAKSLNAKLCVFVEAQKSTFLKLQKKISGKENTKVLMCDATKFSFKDHKFNVVILDPPFRMEFIFLESIYNLIKKNLLHSEAVLIVRTGTRADYLFDQQEELNGEIKGKISNKQNTIQGIIKNRFKCIKYLQKGKSHIMFLRFF